MNYLSLYYRRVDYQNWGDFSVLKRTVLLLKKKRDAQSLDFHVSQSSGAALRDLTTIVLSSFRFCMQGYIILELDMRKCVSQHSGTLINWVPFPELITWLPVSTVCISNSVSVLFAKFYIHSF